MTCDGPGADPGYKITQVDVDLGSSNRARVKSVDIVEGGKAVKVQYELTSGPLFDQYRGWIHATVKTSQQKID